MTRKFSIPYNGETAETYFSIIDKYKDSIENVYFGIPTLINNHINEYYWGILRGNLTDEKISHVIQYENNLYDSLDYAQNKYKRILAINSGIYPMDDGEIKMFVKTKLKKLIDNNKVDGFILTDFYMAKYIHDYAPDLELHTSCNTYQTNIKVMDNWRKYAGISVFNPPREILRDVSTLKKIHDEGFKIKAVVNNSCLYGCPNSINHIMSMSINNRSRRDCAKGDYSNILRQNWILPRWLKYYDEYVDIFKIAGRLIKTNRLDNMLDAYINERDDVYLSTLTMGRMAQACNGIKIPVSRIHDELRICECKNCDTCHKCSNLFNELCREQNIIPKDLEE